MAYLINGTSIINDSKQLLTDNVTPSLWRYKNWVGNTQNLFPPSNTTWISGTQNLSSPSSYVPTTNDFSELTILLDCFLITSGTQTFTDHVEVRFGGSEWQRAWNSGETISGSSAILIQIRQFSGSYTTTGKSFIKIWRGITSGTSLIGTSLSSQSYSTYELNFDTGSGTLDDVEVKWPGSTASTMRWRSYAWHR